MNWRLGWRRALRRRRMTTTNCSEPRRPRRLPRPGRLGADLLRSPFGATRSASRSDGAGVVPSWCAALVCGVLSPLTARREGLAHAPHRHPRRGRRPDPRRLLPVLRRARVRRSAPHRSGRQFLARRHAGRPRRDRTTPTPRNISSPVNAAAPALAPTTSRTAATSAPKIPAQRQGCASANSRSRWCTVELR